MKLDRSKQGFIDEDIIPLLNLINKKYQTTSSCSGRITLIKGVKKGEVEWVYKTHSLADPEKVYSTIQNYDNLRFMYEPLIIHVRCKTVEECKDLLNLVRMNGFKRSNVVSLTHFVVEINDTGKLEVPVTKILPKEYIISLIEEANKRLTKTKLKIKKLELLF